MTLKTKHSSRIRDISYSPDGRFLASIGNDDQIIIWSSKVLSFSFFLQKAYLFLTIRFIRTGVQLVCLI